MKVGIIGNYGNNNNGDEAILAGIIYQLTKELHVGKQDITVFSNQPNDTMQRYGVNAVPLYHKKNFIYNTGYLTLYRSYQTMKGLDLVIIGGGGLLMDLYRRGAPLYYSLGKMAKMADCKLVIYGVGAGPIRTLMGRFFIKRLLHLADLVSVRDAESLSLLKEIGVKKHIDLIGDPAFNLPIAELRTKSDQVKHVGVTAVPYYNHQYWPTEDKEKYTDYIYGMADNINQMMLDHPDIQLTLFSTKYPHDVQVTEDIFDLLHHQKRVKLVEDNLTPEKLIELISEFDLVIGTRLHSLILSVVTQTPVIGICYHMKVLSFMKYINKERFNINIPALTEEKTLFSSMVATYNQEWAEQVRSYVSISHTMKDNGKQGVYQLTRVIYDKKDG